jgi:small conductance mechanosensitive channel
VSEHFRSALITGVVGVGIVAAVYFFMTAAWKGYLVRVGDKRTKFELAGQRTRFVILRRLVTVLLLAIVAWGVLQEFPSTDALARSLLASTAFITVFIGIAFATPLTNVGAGILLGWSQSVRLGDRVTINDITGTATEISLVQTVLITDEGRRVFVPNSQMASSIITNRSINDPRRSVSVQLPIAITKPVEEARAAVLAAVEGFEGAKATDVTVLVSEVTEKTVWLTLMVRLPPESDVASVTADLRERALSALVREQLLPA